MLKAAQRKARLADRLPGRRKTCRRGCCQPGPHTGSESAGSTTATCPPPPARPPSPPLSCSPAPHHTTSPSHLAWVVPSVVVVALRSLQHPPHVRLAAHQHSPLADTHDWLLHTISGGA